MEPKELPPMWALDMAAKAAGDATETWNEIRSLVTGRERLSIIAHARTIAKYEKPPVDEAELKRRQDAREAVAKCCEAILYDRGAREARVGGYDTETGVQFAYIALCHRDGVTPVPVEEWGK